MPGITTVLLISLFIPAVMLIAGWMMYRHPPRDINGLIGYRTRRSGSSREAWLFAQRYCGYLWMVIGGALIPVSLLPVLFLSPEGRSAALTFLTPVHVAALLLSILPVERALKRNFDENGAPRTTRPED